MNQKYSNLIAIELALYETHTPEYNPVQKIIEFWKKYDIGTIQNTINMVLKNAPAYTKNGNVLELCHKQIFAVDLLRLLIAYFHVHTDYIDISQVDISEAETTQRSLDELELTKRIHDFFGRITQ